METPTITPTRFVNGDALQLVGIEKHYTLDTMVDIPAQWKAFPAQECKVAYGVLTDDPDGKGFAYMSANELGDVAQMPADFTTKHIPAQKYAVFTHEGHISKLPDTFYAIFRTWLPGSGYEPTHTPDSFERYGTQFDPKSGTGDIEVWVPIKG